MHFCSVLPFHIVNDKEEKKAKALYIMGTILINKLIEELIDEERYQSEELLRFCKFEEWFSRITYKN